MSTAMLPRNTAAVSNWTVEAFYDFGRSPVTRVACARCRVLHRACDGESPCTRCVRAQAECSFRAPRKRGRKRRSPEDGSESPSSPVKSYSPPYPSASSYWGSEQTTQLFPSATSAAGGAVAVPPPPGFRAGPESAAAATSAASLSAAAAAAAATNAAVASPGAAPLCFVNEPVAHCVIVPSADCFISSVTDRFCELVNAPVDALVGTSLFSYVADNSHPIFRSLGEFLGKPFFCEWRSADGNDTHFRCAVKCDPLSQCASPTMTASSVLVTIYLSTTLVLSFKKARR